MRSIVKHDAGLPQAVRETVRERGAVAARYAHTELGPLLRNTVGIGCGGLCRQASSSSRWCAARLQDDVRCLGGPAYERVAQLVADDEALWGGRGFMPLGMLCSRGRRVGPLPRVPRHVGRASVDAGIAAASVGADGDIRVALSLVPLENTMVLNMFVGCTCTTTRRRRAHQDARRPIEGSAHGRAIVCCHVAGSAQAHRWLCADRASRARRPQASGARQACPIARGRCARGGSRRPGCSQVYSLRCRALVRAPR